jgi:Type IV secretion system pilin
MTKLQKILYSTVGLAATTSAALAGPFDGKAVTIGGTSQNSVEVTAQNLINQAMLYISILAVCYGIWGGFQILTAGGDEEKVKKGRTIMLQVVIGIVVIWLAGSVVKWVVGLVAGA